MRTVILSTLAVAWIVFMTLLTLVATIGGWSIHP